MAVLRHIAVLAVLAATALAAVAEDEVPVLTIGYLDLVEDVRYDSWGIHPVDIRSSTATPDRRALAGAELGIADLAALERVAKTRFALTHERVTGSAEMVAAIERLGAEQDVHLFVIDAPTAIMAEVAARTGGGDLLLFNATANGDPLRNDFCQPHLMHTAPSEAMLTDALAQYLVDRGWDEVLILRGPLEEDFATSKSFERAAELFGIEVTEVRDFVLGADPRAREQNDLAFLTGGGVDYDAVFVADAVGEFALGVPYATSRPAAVLGAAGLVARAWHWSHLRHGAPQVHGRFERLHSRRMEAGDWGAWVAMKAIGEAVARTRATDAEAIGEFLKSDQARIDGSKGIPLSFRPWDNQLRQRILLGTENWVVALAPLEGFRHRTNDMDTLGHGERDTECEF